MLKKSFYNFFKKCIYINLAIVSLIHCSVFSGDYNNIALEFSVDYNKINYNKINYNKKATTYKDIEFYDYVKNLTLFKSIADDIKTANATSPGDTVSDANCNKFLNHFEWIYFAAINDDYHVIKLQDTGENSILTKPWSNSTYNLKKLFYPIHLATKNKLHHLQQYYATLDDYELLTIIFNYQKLNITMYINSFPYYENSKSKLEVITAKTLLKRFLQKDKYKLFKEFFSRVQFVSDKLTFDNKHLDYILEQIIVLCPHIKNIQCALEYINDTLIDIITDPNKPYQIETKNGELDLSNLNLKKNTLAKIYHHNPEKKPIIINWNTLDCNYAKHLYQMASNIYFTIGSYNPDATHYVHCNGIDTINLEGNPELDFFSILKLTRVFYNVKKIIVDPSVILTIPKENDLTFLIENNYIDKNVEYLCKEYLYHFTIDRKVLKKIDENSFLLIPYDTLSIKLAEKNAAAKAIISTIYKTAHNYYMHILISQCLGVILTTRLIVMIVLNCNPARIFSFIIGFLAAAIIIFFYIRPEENPLLLLRFKRPHHVTPHDTPLCLLPK